MEIGLQLHHSDGSGSRLVRIDDHVDGIAAMNAVELGDVGPVRMP